MWKYMINLQDPYMVSNIQKFFGIKCLDSSEENRVLNDDNSILSPKNTNIVCKNHDDPDLDLKCDNANDKSINDDNSQLESWNLSNQTPHEIESAVTTVVPEKHKQLNYVIVNKFWYYLFFLGTYLGDELGYAIFFPFWFWNVNGVVGKRLILIWALIMYIGQAVKDIICWPRPPSPPVVRLQEKWSLEYGMPSTHAMVGVALPASVIFFTSNRFQYPIEIAVIIAVFVCALISVSRLYLGMHTILDIIAGIVFCSLLLIPIIPLCDAICEIFNTFKYSPFVIVLVSLILIFLYPVGKTWTPTRGDTTVVLGVCTGVEIGYWAICNFNFEVSQASSSVSVIYSSSTTSLIWHSIGITVVRTLTGYVCIILLFVIWEYLIWLIDSILTKFSFNFKDPVTKRRIPILDLSYKYVIYGVTSFSIVYFIPLFFQYIQLGRLNYFSEC